MLMSNLVIFCLLTKEVLLQSDNADTDNEYCQLGSTHTMCATPEKGPACGTSGYSQKIPTVEEKTRLLQWHNDIRERAATGLETDAGEKLPSAKYMYKLEWDDELARIAQRHCDQCVFDHDCNECRNVLNERFPVVMQNLGQMKFEGLNPKFNYTLIMDPWYKDEVALVNRQLLDNFQFDASWGHYTQLIWADTQYLGCGGCSYKNGTQKNQFVTCNYGPGGNIMDTPIYVTGDPCSACPEGTKCGSESSLCIKKASLKGRKQTSKCKKSKRKRQENNSSNKRN